MSPHNIGIESFRRTQSLHTSIYPYSKPQVFVVYWHQGENMPQTKDRLISGYYFHIYNRAVDGSQLFPEERNYTYFLSKIKKYLLVSSEIIAYCLMPNHYHFLIKVLQDGFSKSMHKLSLSYVVAFNKAYQRKGHLFQGSFQRIHIKDLNYLLHLSQYIHLNPLHANLVS